jgi:hypothetical protein
LSIEDVERIDVAYAEEMDEIVNEPSYRYIKYTFNGKISNVTNNFTDNMADSRNIRKINRIT